MSSLWDVDADGGEQCLLDQYQPCPVDFADGEQRFVTLLPCSGDKSEFYNHVRCEIKAERLPSAEPYIAIKNARGYRLLSTMIEANGQAMAIPVALERFLRHLRRSDGPLRIWTRYLCLHLDRQDDTEYWTRPFVEQMYTNAVEVVDMSEFNSKLIDEGVIEKVIQPGLAQRSKIWENLDERRLASPQIYPIWLGALFVNARVSKPTFPFRYVPLDRVTDEIRVLVVAPAEDPSSPLILDIAHCPLTGPVEYAALSYTWGDAVDDHEIYLNGQVMKVRSNLWKSLHAMRRKKGLMQVWADAICINQSDGIERSQQIPRIGEIYKRAGVVQSYIGDAMESTKAVLQFIRALHKIPLFRNEQDNLDYTAYPDGFKSLASLCSGLLSFLDRRYFRRVWILQEICDATSPALFVGDDKDDIVTFQMLDTAAYNLEDILRFDHILYEEVRASTHIEDPFTTISYSRKLFYFRRLHKGPSQSMHIFDNFPPSRQTSPGYLEAAILTRDFEATDPRDKIFSLWNLAMDKDGLDLRMNYEQTLREAYMNFATAWSQQHGRLDVIGASEYGNRSNDEFYTSAPSWCADWSTQAEASNLVRRDWIPNLAMYAVWDLGGALYTADGNVKQERMDQYFRFEGSTLHCTGVIIDTVLPVHFSSSRELEDLAPSVVEIINHYNRGNFTHYPDVFLAICAMLHGDSVRNWRGKVQWQTQESDHASEPRSDIADDTGEDLDTEEGQESDERTATYIATLATPFDRWTMREQPPPPHESRHIPRAAGDYNRAESREVSVAVRRGRDLFLTEGGYIGLAPSGAMRRFLHGDGAPERNRGKSCVLAVLATCSVPVLLQEVEADVDDNEGGTEKEGGNDGLSTYRLLGTCFVQGWMDGEMVTDFMGADTAHQFWEGLGDVGKLKIV